MIKNLKWLVLVSLTFVACNDDETVVYNTSDGLIPTAGTANFSKYVSLGNSLTAGYSDNALVYRRSKRFLSKYNGKPVCFNWWWRFYHSIYE